MKPSFPSLARFSWKALFKAGPLPIVDAACRVVHVLNIIRMALAGCGASLRWRVRKSAMSEPLYEKHLLKIKLQKYQVLRYEVNQQRREVSP
ncbi:hypothetical protein H0A71_07730 [Alcaligenaceae bacterium]|nr:hypothetical protein [Alcaligenaceae bacterium]